MSALESAIDYGLLGLPVIPLRDRDKIPRFKGWPESASIDPSVIRHWFAKHPDANVGLVMGRGLVALDFDASRGGIETHLHLNEDDNLPETATAMTGGGGRHLIYRTTFPIGNRADFRNGMDVKGVRGFIVVAPSIHPVTGKPYIFERHPSQGIAEAPSWLTEALARDEKDDSSITPPNPSRLILGPSRTGDIGLLSSDLIRRFPVLGRGRRNDQMVKCIGSLLSRGFEDRTIEETVKDWWHHFDNQGNIGTNRKEAPKLIQACIESMKRSPKFFVGGSLDHRKACAEIQITPEQRRLIGSKVSALQELGGGTILDLRGENRIGVTLTSRRLSDRLCESSGEVAFVETILIQVSHEIACGHEDFVNSTHDQLCQIANDRNPEIRWDHRQVERLLSKYVTRPDKQAAVFELMKQCRQGQRGSPGKPGTPSRYEPTGIRIFLA